MIDTSERIVDHLPVHTLIVYTCYKGYLPRSERAFGYARNRWLFVVTVKGPTVCYTVCQEVYLCVSTFALLCWIELVPS